MTDQLHRPVSNGSPQLTEGRVLVCCECVLVRRCKGFKLVCSGIACVAAYRGVGLPISVQTTRIICGYEIYRFVAFRIRYLCLVFKS